MNRPVIALLTSVNQSISAMNLKTLNYAAETAQLLRSSAVALVIGSPPVNELHQLSDYGAQRIYCLRDGRVNDTQIKACAKAAIAVMNAEHSNILISSQDDPSKAIAARVAIQLQAGYVTNVSSPPYVENGFVLKHAPPFTDASAYTRINSHHKVIVIRSNHLKIKRMPVAATVENLDINFEERDFTRYRKTSKKAAAVNLSEARVVVSGGLGVHTVEKWQLLESLGHELNAAVGCTQPIVDLGLQPASSCIGLYGTSISPQLYIAVGISGAPHHLRGIKDAKTIFAINQDEHAPIFRIADYGIIGDTNMILPQLIRELNRIETLL